MNTRADRWAMFAAAALTGLSSNPDSTTEQDASLAATTADDLMKEYEKRFGEKKSKPDAVPPAPTMKEVPGG